jgi:hypothetical protein
MNYHVLLFSQQKKFDDTVNINYRLPIKIYFRICTLRHIRIEINHGSPECVLRAIIDFLSLHGFPEVLKVPF